MKSDFYLNIKGKINNKSAYDAICELSGIGIAIVERTFRWSCGGPLFKACIVTAQESLK